MQWKNTIIKSSKKINCKTNYKNKQQENQETFYLLKFRNERGVMLIERISIYVKNLQIENTKMEYKNYKLLLVIKIIERNIDKT